MSEKKVWFITGCSTGFGRELAKHLLENDYRVVVTARDADKVQDLVDINLKEFPDSLLRGFLIHPERV